MQAGNLLSTVSDLSCLKGFPRSDAQALYVIAEALLRRVKPEGIAVPDSVLQDRANAIVQHVIATAPEWRGPAQFEAAQISIAEANQRWDIPRDWKRQGTECGSCCDTGAIQMPDGSFGLCLCPAGADALDHVHAMNVTREESLRRRERARERRKNAAEVTA